MRTGDTIVALSSGALPSGVAVLRLSGPAVEDILTDMTGQVPPPRQLVLHALRLNGLVLDRGLVAYFPAPYSFTGEACAELQVHGSHAVVRALLNGLAAKPGVRLAEAGEFTRRAFENSKLDLTEVEGLGDLIAAETEQQRVQALGRMAGGLTEKIDAWRETLIGLRAEIEARLDFSDESDVASDLPEDWSKTLNGLRADIGDAVKSVAFGRIVREGYRIALAGPPNAGKSSLINALARSDLAIVSEEAGTTRDIKEVPIDLDGQLVIFVDMAGLRETDSKAEAEGVRRARDQIESADLVLWLIAPDQSEKMPPELSGKLIWPIATKADLGVVDGETRLQLSAKTGDGLDELMSAITAELQTVELKGGNLLVSRERDRIALENCLSEMDAIEVQLEQPELAAEGLRRASDALARLTGAMDSEAILDRLFAGFCIGK